MAEEADLDLVVISPNQAPPVAKILNYGKYKYELEKKAKEGYYIEIQGLNHKEVFYMIVREDILSMEYLKKTEYTGCHQGMRYRLEGVATEEGKKLKTTVWPEPFNFFTTPEEQKESKLFDFEEDGIIDAIAWMNDCLFQDKDKWERAPKGWVSYRER
jgi:hypothetical protein